MRSTTLDQIDPRRIDFGVGMLRGALSRVSPEAAPDLEVTIDHMRKAARLIERLQRERWASQRRLRRAGSRSRKA